MRLLLLLLASALASCSTLIPAPDLDLAGRDPQAAWARHLARTVDASGAIDFEAMREDSSDLDLVVAWIAAERPPESDRSAELAWLINAYNALAMYDVLHSGVLPEDKVRFFYLREFEVRGRRLSLYALENDVLRVMGEPRVHFALNCMVRSCPRLPREPFRADTLDRQLDAAAREFLNEPRHVRLDPEHHAVRLSAILDWYAEDFLAVAPSLIAYANRYRTEAIPEDWRVKFLPYDWTLNRKR